MRNADVLINLPLGVKASLEMQMSKPQEGKGHCGTAVFAAI